MTFFLSVMVCEREMMMMMINKSVLGEYKEKKDKNASEEARTSSLLSSAGGEMKE